MCSTRSIGAAAAAVLLALSVVWLAAAGAAKPPLTQWEYKIVWPPVNLEKFEDSPGGLNELGADGWELVSVTPPTDKEYRYFCVLKRPK